MYENGAKTYIPKEKRCRKCGGTGVEAYFIPAPLSPFGKTIRYRSCPYCLGDGEVPKDPYQQTFGRKYFEK